MITKFIGESFLPASKRLGMTLASLLFAFLLTYWLKEPTFTDSQVYALFCLFMAIGLWVTDAVPPYSVGILILFYLVLTMGNPVLNDKPDKIAQYVNQFSSSSIWLFLGGFFLAAGMSKVKLDEQLLQTAIKISGTEPRKILFGIMMTTMIASMFMSNTATTAMVLAMLMPIFTRLGATGFAKALLLGVPLAASTGGMGTVIGTPPNAVAVQALVNAGIQIDFLKWMIYGAPLAILLTYVGYVLLSKIFIKDNSAIDEALLKMEEFEMTPMMKLQRKIVIFITIITIILWATELLHGLTVAIVAAIPMVIFALTGIVTGKDVQEMSWDTMFMMAGGLALGVALKTTGLTSHYAEMVKEINVSPAMFLLILCFITMLVSNFMSHTAASVLIIPLGITMIPGLEIEAAIGIALSSSVALFLPISTPPNAIAYSTGLLEQKDFRLGGVVLGLIGPALTMIWMLAVK